VQRGSRAATGAYLGLYGSIDWTRTEGFWAGATLWQTASGTTLSFAVRLGALRADRRLHELALRAGTAVDTELCLAYRGCRPYPWPQLLGEAVLGPPGTSLPVPWRVKRAGARAIVNIFAARRSFRPRTLVVAHPALATHVELPHLADGTEWEAVAEAAAAWEPASAVVAGARGSAVRPPGASPQTSGS
jgi:hypothetical protein